MKQDLAFKELEFLLEMKFKLESQGRNLNYDEDRRLKTLREFLDSLSDDTIVETKIDNEIPY